MREPSVRVEDHTGLLAVVFATYVEEGLAATHWVLPGDDVFPSVWAAMRGNVANLDGRPCWVSVHDGRIEFLGMAAL